MLVGTSTAPTVHDPKGTLTFEPEMTGSTARSGFRGATTPGVCAVATEDARGAIMANARAATCFFCSGRVFIRDRVLSGLSGSGEVVVREAHSHIDRLGGVPKVDRSEW